MFKFENCFWRRVFYNLWRQQDNSKFENNVKISELGRADVKEQSKDNLAFRKSFLLLFNLTCGWKSERIENTFKRELFGCYLYKKGLLVILGMFINLEIKQISKWMQLW